MRNSIGIDALRYEIANNLIDDTPSEHVRGRHGRRLPWAFHYLGWPLAIGFFTAVFMFAALSPALAGISAKVMATKENGFGRIVIEFTNLPKFKSEVASSIFVLSFDKPVDVELGQILEAIPKYVGLVRRDPDGMAIRLALNRAFRVNIMEAGQELFIDLLPPDWKGLVPSLPAETIKALTLQANEMERRVAEEARQLDSAKTPYKLKLRLARHPTFSRIVFDWNKFVTVNMTRQGRTIDIKFNKNAKVDLSRLKVDPPKFLQGVNALQTHEGLALTFTVDEDVDVRGFREGMNYVLDLTGPDALVVASAAAVADEVGANKKAAVEGAAKMAKGKYVFSSAGKREEVDTAMSSQASEVKVISKDIDPAILSEKSFVPTGTGEPDISNVEAFGQKQEKLTDIETVAGDTKAKAQMAGSEKTAPSAMKTGKGVKPAPPLSMDAMVKSGGPSPAIKTEALVVESAAGLNFTFQFTEPVAAAIFRRGRSVWAVFDSDAKLDMAGLRRAAGEGVENIKNLQFGKAQYVRIQLKEPQLVHVSYANNGWNLTIGDMAGGETNPLKLVRALRDDRRSIIKVRLKDNGRVHWLTDPEIGDRLAVVTAFPPQRNVAKPQEMVDFSAFSTAHGIAIRPKSDDVAVRLHLDEVLITRRDGLLLSAGNTSQYLAGKKSLRNSARIGFIDFKKWHINSPKELSDKIHDLQRIIAEAPREQMNVKRFDLATIYAANELHVEALGLMNRMKNVDEEVAADPSYNTLRGAMLALLGRLDEAEQEFGVHALANDTDASLWRGLIATKAQRWDAALGHFKDGMDAIRAYELNMQARFRLAAVRAALEIKKLSRAAEELNAIPSSAMSGRIKAEADLHAGNYLNLLGRSEEARESLKAAEYSGYESIAAEARLMGTLLDLKTGAINSKEAIMILERLQLFWRGDDIELRTIRALAGLYVQEKRYQDAFAIMRQSIEAFPKEKLAMQIQDDLKLEFKNLFLHGGSEKLEPVPALALFYGNRELTPVGRLGDEMIRRLTDRLISVDLLDQAVELLDHQVNKRLKGAARAQVATRLAMVHLLNRKPALALRVVRRTRQAGLPEDLYQSRNLIEARALGELGRAGAAVEILNTMQGESVEQLKADAYWTAREWKNAGQQLEKVLGGRWRDPEPLSDTDRFNVLRAAISYSLADDQFALDRLGKKFYPKLVKTPDAESFLLVTKPVRSKGVAFRNLAKEIASIDTLDAFMKQFRASYRRSTVKPEKRAGQSDAATGSSG